VASESAAGVRIIAAAREWRVWSPKEARSYGRPRRAAIAVKSGGRSLLSLSLRLRVRQRNARTERVMGAAAPPQPVKVANRKPSSK